MIFFVTMAARPRPDLLGGEGECLLRRELPVALNPSAARARSLNCERLLAGSILVLLSVEVFLH
jgi:hypothetical protein